MRDLKSLGLPRDRAPMSDRGWNFCLGLVGVIFMLAVYGLVVDEPDRMVVMSRAAFDKATLDARRCSWRDLFTDPRGQGRAPM